jgi:DNA-binding transcriptional ArsR family regulator
VIDPDTADLIAEVMDGLAAGTRIQLLCRLAQGPRSVKQLTTETDMEQPAVSQQLRVLRDLNFVRAEKQGRKKIYQLRDPHIAGLLEQAISHAEHLRQHAQPNDR